MMSKWWDTYSVFDLVTHYHWTAKIQIPNPIEYTKGHLLDQSNTNRTYTDSNGVIPNYPCWLYTIAILPPNMYESRLILNPCYLLGECFTKGTILHFNTLIDLLPISKYSDTIRWWFDTGGYWWLSSVLKRE